MIKYIRRLFKKKYLVRYYFFDDSYYFTKIYYDVFITQRYIHFRVTTKISLSKYYRYKDICENESFIRGLMKKHSDKWFISSDGFEYSVYNQGPFSTKEEIRKMVRTKEFIIEFNRYLDND